MNLYREMFIGIRKLTSAGGGLIAFGLSATQTTLISFDVAHNCDKEYLGIFSFLLSVLYFSIQLLRRNVIEPFYRDSIPLISKHYRRQILLVLSQASSISLVTALTSELFKLSLSLLVLTVTSVLWEIKKAELRKADSITSYTILEFLLVSILILIIAGNFLGIVISGETTIFTVSLMKAIFILKSRIGEDSRRNFSERHQLVSQITTYAFGEYFFVAVILFTNFYFIFRGYASQIGEIRAVFLLLIGSTFSVGALRNSLAGEMKYSISNLSILGVFSLNLIFVCFLPVNLLQRIIPSVPDNFRSLFLPIALDIFGSLIFAVSSLQLLRLGNLLSSSRARTLSALTIILTIGFLVNINLDAKEICWVYASASIISALYVCLISRIQKLSAN
jgi:hypothetical protein